RVRFFFARNVFFICVSRRRIIKMSAMESSGLLQIRQLPVLPQVATQILMLSDDMSFSELERMVKADQAISALILKAANSSFYARNGNVKTIQQAGTLMGIKMIRSLILLSA